MRWRNMRESDNIEDRQGQSSGGFRLGGGGVKLGGLGLVAVVRRRRSAAPAPPTPRTP